MSTTKEDRSFKTLISRATTDSTNKFFFNEFGEDTINVHADDIWSNTIPFDDPSQAVTDGVAELRTLFVLTEDLSVPSSQSWKAESPPDTRLRNWISPKFGDSFNIRLFDNNDVEIFTTDPLDWFFDYQTGILTINGNALSKTRPFKITGYRYIGIRGINKFVVDQTEEDFIITMDSSGGTDPSDPIRIHNQAESDAWGAFKTVPGVIAAIPDFVIHKVVLEFPDGVFILNDQVFGEFARLTFGISGVHDPFFGPVVEGSISFRSLNGLIRETATSTYAVSGSSTDREVILQSNPGFGDNDHRAKYLRVVSGTGAAQLKAIRSHSGVTWPVAGKFSPILDATSVVEIVRPAAEMKFSAGTPIPTVKGQVVISKIIFDAIDVRNPSDFAILIIQGPTLELNNGARILSTGLSLSFSSVLLSECVIDCEGTASIPISAQSGYIRSSSNSLTWLLRDGISAGISLFSGSGQNVFGGGAVAFLLAGAIDDIAPGFGFDGDGIIVDAKGSILTSSTGVLIQGSGNAGVGVRLSNGGQMQFDSAAQDAAADALTGVGGDIALDGNVVTWNDLDTDPEKTLQSTRQSIATGDI